MNKKGLLIVLVSCLLALVLLGACAKQAATAKAADFYKSNKITFLSTSAAGAKTDLIARAIQPFFQTQTGGTVQVEDNGDGGGVVARNIVYTAKPDGLLIGVVAVGTQWADFFAKKPAGQDDVTKIRYLGAFGPSGYSLLVNSNSPIRTLDDLKKAKKLKFASTAPNSAYGFVGALVINAMQLEDAQIITGYRGAADIYQALKSGEVDVMVTGTAIAQGYHAQGTGRVLFTIGMQRETAYYPDVPALPEVVKLSAQHQTWTEVVDKAMSPTTSFYTAPGVPEENVKYLRGIFDKISTDKAVVDALTKATQIYTGYESAEQTEKNLKRMEELKIREVMVSFSELVDKYRKK